MTDEALKLALEFLEDNKHYIIENERREYLLMYEAVIDKCKEALAQPEQEPVASIFISGIGEREFDDWGHDLPVGRNLLYITSPQRTWVGLTVDEIETIWRKVEAGDFHDCVLPFAEKLEARLKEKNCA